MNNTTHPAEITERLLELMDAQARTSSGNASHYAYLAGMLQGFIRSVQWVPAVQDEMQAAIRNLERDAN